MSSAAGWAKRMHRNSGRYCASWRRASTRQPAAPVGRSLRRLLRDRQPRLPATFRRASAGRSLYLLATVAGPAGPRRTECSDRSRTGPLRRPRRPLQPALPADLPGRREPTGRHRGAGSQRLRTCGTGTGATVGRVLPRTFRPRREPLEPPAQNSPPTAAPHNWPGAPAMASALLRSAAASAPIRAFLEHCLLAPARAPEQPGGRHPRLPGPVRPGSTGPGAEGLRSIRRIPTLRWACAARRWERLRTHLGRDRRPGRSDTTAEPGAGRLVQRPWR